MARLLTLLVVGATVVLPFFGATTAPAAEDGWQQAGLRAGTRFGEGKKAFQMYEAFAAYALPWEWRNSSGWGLAPRLTVAAGALTSSDVSGFIGTAGAGVLVGKPKTGPGLEVAVMAALLDKRTFGTYDLGSMLLFGGSVGVSWRFPCGLGLAYHIKHLSTGHLFYSDHTPNPGLDMHMIEASWHW
ncbi:acyloxyacyl hydrolase [Trichlorobacter ammonificans]|uniref:Acyloxyacyl hydrolase n=1 Tax=Trichlorobacter ammonificans TaxID=2916410 RepID=A0ABM9D9J6_9BACT|nr:acyloxyacyl hydrolase [Trichlorobacter ammonificans]CAH2031896.1 conserved exported protein of unknown function [Trichlorobacter ammonificans]